MNSRMVVTACANLLFVCCSSQADPIELIKGGVLEFDKSTTIGAAFDKYRFFHGHTKWSTFQTENERTVVEVVGSIEMAGLVPIDIVKVFAQRVDPSQISKEMLDGTAADIADTAKIIKSVDVVTQFLVLKDGTFRLHTMGIRSSNDGTPTPTEPLGNAKAQNDGLRQIYENELMTRVALIPKLIGSDIRHNKADPPPMPPSPTLAKKEAVKRYPSLGIAGSKLNIEFVARYNRYRRERPHYFDDPAWPMVLAEECASGLKALPH